MEKIVTDYKCQQPRTQNTSHTISLYDIRLSVMGIWFSSQNIKEERRFHVEGKLVAISSIVIGLKNSYLPLISLPSFYRTVCYWIVCNWAVCYWTVQ